MLGLSPQAPPENWQDIDMTTPQLRLPADLLPTDGRFGSGPAKIPTAHLQQLVASGLMGTSHRQPPIRNLVAEIRAGLVDLLQAPAGYEVLLGNGGSSAFWALATVGLVKRQAVHAVFGEFGAKFAAETDRAPFLAPSVVHAAAPGQLATVAAHPEADVYAWPHNETSTGVVSPVGAVAGAAADALTVVDATSIAGAVQVNLAEVDVYYFAPQKALASDGGLWLAICSPRALARIAELAHADRWVPEFLSLPLALANSRQNQTLNTPALATLFLLRQQLRFLADLGGLEAAEARCRAASAHLYQWAEARPWAAPFVAEAHWRSPVVATIDLEGVSAQAVAQVLRANGIVDIDPYRKLGRNQLRVATFPATDPADVARLTACLDWVANRL